MIITRARKKPVEVTAMRWDGTLDRGVEIQEWSENAVVVRLRGETAKLHVTTLEGNVYADPGDYIIRGVAGEFYPCKPGIFHETYEIIEGEQALFPAP